MILSLRCKGFRPNARLRTRRTPERSFAATCALDGVADRSQKRSRIAERSLKLVTVTTRPFLQNAATTCVVNDNEANRYDEDSVARCDTPAPQPKSWNWSAR